MWASNFCVCIWYNLKYTSSNGVLDMAMIKCEECGQEISESASVCPHCGHRNKRSVGFLLGIGIFLFPIIFAWFTLRKGHSTLSRVLSFGWLLLNMLIIIGASNSPQPNYGDENTVSKAIVSTSSVINNTKNVPDENIIQVNIGQILSDYEHNEVAADNKYKGKLVQVSGHVTRIKKDLFDNLYITLGTGEAFEVPEFQAFFDDSMNDVLGQISKGSFLTVTCRVEGLMMNVIGKECVIQ